MVLRIKEAQVQLFNMTQHQPRQGIFSKEITYIFKTHSKLVHMSEILVESPGCPEQPARSMGLMSSTMINNKNPP